jgi:hypothetical protein
MRNTAARWRCHSKNNKNPEEYDAFQYAQTPALKSRSRVDRSLLARYSAIDALATYLDDRIAGFDREIRSTGQGSGLASFIFLAVQPAMFWLIVGGEAVKA